MVNIELVKRVVNAIATEKSEVILTPHGAAFLLSAVVKLPDMSNDTFVDQNVSFDLKNINECELQALDKQTRARLELDDANIELANIRIARNKILDAVNAANIPSQDDAE